LFFKKGYERENGKVLRGKTIYCHRWKGKRVIEHSETDPYVKRTGGHKVGFDKDELTERR